MAAVTVRPVRSSADRRAFLDLPYAHYADAANFVPPLRMDQKAVLSPKKNPFFEHGAMELFLAERGGEVVGRVAAIENGQHLAKHADGNGFFGFFETPDDEAVSGALLDAAAAWLRGRGLTGVRGPTNPTMNDVSGLLVDGFDRPPAVLLPYNYPYYERLLEAWGFERAMTMWAYYGHVAYIDDARTTRGADLVRRRHPSLSVRALDRSRFEEEVATAMRIYNEAWKDNWGHVPYTDAEALHLANEMKPILDEDLFLFVEDDGEPIAFSVSLPNLNRALRHLPRGRLRPGGLARLLATWKLSGIYEIRLALLGVLPTHRNLGLDILMAEQTYLRARAAGYDAAEFSWVLDVNAPLMNLLNKMGCARDKEYAMFQASLDR